MAELKKEESGSLGEIPPVQLFIRAEIAGFSGAIALARGNERRSYLFERGKPVSARSNLEAEYLGAILAENKRISQEQETTVLAKMAALPGAHFGETLVSMGFLDGMTLISALQDQLRMRISRALDWVDGKFVFVVGQKDHIPKVQIDEAVTAIIFRALVRRHSESAEAKALDPNIRPISSLGHSIDIASLRLDAKETTLYRSVDGVSVVADLAKKCRLNDQATKATLLAWRDMAFLRLEKREAPQPTSRPEPPSITIELKDRCEKSEKQTYYEILGVGQKATVDEIKKVYLEFARKFHPDRLPKDLPADLRSKASAFFARVTQAHATLTNTSQRAHYDESLALAASGITEDVARKAIESEFEFQKGLGELRKGSFYSAGEYFEKAISLYDAEAEYWVYLGWAQYRQNLKNGVAGAASKGKDTIKKGLKKNENVAEAYYFLGQIAKAENEMDISKKYFQKTLSLNPKHTQAESELRLMNMRAQGSKPALGGLFGKAKAQKA